MNLQTGSVSKGDFAVMLGVSPGRVSQYIAEGKIFGAAIEGEGRRAKINPVLAKDQLRKTLEPGQRFGANGAAMRAPEPKAQQAPDANLFTPRGDAPPSPPPPGTQDQPVDELAQLRLRRERIKTDQAEREELLDVGRYMLTEDGRRAMAKAIAAAFSVMEQGLQQMSEAMAEQFGVPQRDAHHALAKSFRAVRAVQAERFRQQADAEPVHVEDASE